MIFLGINIIRLIPKIREACHTKYKMAFNK